MHPGFPGKPAGAVRCFGQCFSWKRGPCHHLDVALTHSTYPCMIADHVQPLMLTTFPDGCDLDQRWSKSALRDTKLSFPQPNSPDLNSDEHLRDRMDSQVRSIEALPRLLEMVCC